MSTDDKTKPAGDGRVVLTTEQRAAYARSMEQGEAVFALEDLYPSAHDLAIKQAVLDGRVTPQQAHAELLAWVTEHKTVDGFIETRDWAQ